jgi:hypothetical protein
MSQKIARFHLISRFRGSLKSRVVYLCKEASLQFFITEYKKRMFSQKSESIYKITGHCVTGDK